TVVVCSTTPEPTMRRPPAPRIRPPEPCRRLMSRRGPARGSLAQGLPQSSRGVRDDPMLARGEYRPVAYDLPAGAGGSGARGQAGRSAPFWRVGRRRSSLPEVLAMVLGDLSLWKLLNDLIRDPDPDLVNPASIDVRVGHEMLLEVAPGDWKSVDLTVGPVHLK